MLGNTVFGIVTLFLGVAGGMGRDLAPLSEKHRQWLNEEVVYIMAERERAEFLALAGESERERCRERFWELRDTDTSTEENEFRAEHYRRIRHANERFHDGKPGWKTERGRAYIQHGPPDNISFIFGGNPLYIDIENPTTVLTQDSNPDRRRNFRLSFTTPEAEIWIYRRLEGAEHTPSYFQVIFARIDPTQLYELNQRLQHLGESSDLSYQQRMERDYAVMDFFRSQRIGGEYRVLYAGEYKFQDVDDFYQSIFHPRRLPHVSIADLQLGLQDLQRSPGDVLYRRLSLSRGLKEKVESRVFYNRIPLSLCMGTIRADSGGTLVPFTIGFPAEAGAETVELVVELVRADGRTAASLMDSVALKSQAFYHNRLGARPGTYRLNVYASSRRRPASGFLSREVQLPDYSGSDLELSDLLLFDKVMPRKSAGSRLHWGAIVLRDYVLFPAPESRFRRGENLTVFFEVYNPGVPPGAKEPALEVKCKFWKEGHLAAAVPVKILDYVGKVGDGESSVGHTAYGLSIPLRSFQPGEYTLQVNVLDQVLKRNVSRQTSFQVY